MTNKMRYTFVAGIVALTVAVAVPALMAQNPPRQGPRMGRQFGPGGPGGPGGPDGPMIPGLRALDLTDLQRDQVKGIVDSHKDEFEQVGEKMRTARQAMGELAGADVLDENAIRAKSADVANAEADAVILNAKVRAEVFATLTPEQLQKAKEFKAQRQERRQQRGERMKQRGPGNRQQR